MHKNRMKFIVSFVLILSLIIMMAACGSKTSSSQESPVNATNNQGSTTDQPTDQPKKEPVELTLMTYNELSNLEGLKKVIDLYQQQTGNKVKLDIYPYDQFYNVLKTKMSTNDAPDLFMCSFGANYVSYSYLEPLDGSPYVDKMIPVVKNRGSENGKVYEAYASPVGYYGILYNKDIFAKAGVKVPLMNYQQLLDAMKAIKKIGITPIMMPGKAGWTYEMIPALGGVYVMKKNPELPDKLAKNQSKMSKEPAFMQLAERTLALKEYMNSDHMSLDYGTDAWKALLDGKYAMTFMGDWLSAEFEKASPGKIGNIGMMPVTLDEEYISAIASLTQSAFGVPANSKHKDESKALINFALAPENFNTTIAPKIGPSPYEGYKSELSPWQQEMESYIKADNLPITNSYLNEFWNTFQFGDSYSPWQAMFTGKPVEKVYDDWYKDYERLNRAQKTPGWE